MCQAKRVRVRVRVCASVFAADRYKSAAPAAVAVESVRLVLLAVIDT